MEKRAAALEDAFQKNPEKFDREALLAGYPAYVLMIDDYDRLVLRCESAGRQLAECLSAGGDAGLSMIVAGNGTDLPKDYDDDLMKARKVGCSLFSGNAQIDQYHSERPEGAKQSPSSEKQGDCFVASLLAMTSLAFFNTLLILQPCTAGGAASIYV